MAGTKELYEHFLQTGKICIDSRNVEAGCIFFALKGEHFDGNKFAHDALRKGAALAVVDDKTLKEQAGLFRVENVLSSLQDLARHHRNTLKIPIIGLTGSNGKTTTKELLREVLKKKYTVHATPGNLNNHIGVPISLLGIRKETEIAVIEMGANHVGEIADLCSIARPTYGLITNIGKAHLEGFGNYEGVIRAKTELYDFIQANGGEVFVNADDKLLMGLSEKLTRYTYGKTALAGTRGSILASVPFLDIHFNGNDIKTRLYGDYNFWNIMASICIGSYFGVNTTAIKEAISSYKPNNNRSQVIIKGSNAIYLDAYNANPTSMEAAIEQFMKQKASKKVLILGDMLELGEFSAEEHSKLLSSLQTLDAQIILVGPEFSEAAKGKQDMYFINTEKASAWLAKNPIRDAHILVKGSRGIALEKLLDLL